MLPLRLCIGRKMESKQSANLEAGPSDLCAGISGATGPPYNGYYVVLLNDDFVSLFSHIFTLSFILLNLDSLFYSLGSKIILYTLFFKLLYLLPLGNFSGQHFCDF